MLRKLCGIVFVVVAVLVGVLFLDAATLNVNSIQHRLHEFSMWGARSFASSGLKMFGKSRVSPINGTLAMAGLKKPVDIIRDNWGVPHIYAQSEQDMYFAQGFVHAQDRLWQMETQRRIATGTLAALVGDKAVPTDKITRTIGFHRAAEKRLQILSAEEHAMLDAYLSGINGFLNSPWFQLPVEYSVMSKGWSMELSRQQILDAVGPELLNEVDINFPPNVYHSPGFGLKTNTNVADAGKDNYMDQAGGSNIFVVAPKKSTTGYPILANDIHLPLSNPNIWYEIHMQAPSNEVYGVSLPIGPGIVVGRNKHIAWGVTLSNMDVEDLFVEDFGDDFPNTYKHKGKVVKANVIKETINIKGGAQETVTIVETLHGPVISEVMDLLNDKTNKRYVSLASATLQLNATTVGMMKLNRAQNFEEFREACRLQTSPPLNMIMADAKGNIGHQTMGRVPIRANNGRGNIPADGSTGEHDWEGYVPFEAMPYEYNPERGFIVSSNNRHVDDGTSQYFFGHAYTSPLRAERITEWLNHKEKFDVNDFVQQHMDVTTIAGKRWKAVLRSVIWDKKDDQIRQFLDAFTGWDGRMSADSVGATLYHVSKYFTYRTMLSSKLEPKLISLAMGAGPHPALRPNTELIGYETVTLLRLLDPNVKNVTSRWVELAGGKSKLLHTAVRKTMKFLTARMGSDTSQWQWSKLHSITFKHALGRVRPLDLAFNIGPMPSDGDGDTPKLSFMIPSADHPSEDAVDFSGAGFNPSWRSVHDMSRPGASQANYGCGQSGQPGSLFYDDRLQDYLTGNLNPFLWTREDVLASTPQQQTIQLKPVPE